MDARQWKIITITSDGSVSEEKMAYEKRSENALGVKMVNFTNTGLMSMGYHTDILKGYPSLIFPFIYPIFTSIVGVVLIVISIRSYRKRNRIL